MRSKNKNVKNMIVFKKVQVHCRKENSPKKLGNTLFYFEKVIKIIWRRTLVVGQQGSITNPKIYFPLKSFFYSSLFSSLSRIKVFKRHLKGYLICSSLFLIFFMIAMKKKITWWWKWFNQTKASCTHLLFFSFLLNTMYTPQRTYSSSGDPPLRFG